MRMFVAIDLDARVKAGLLALRATAGKTWGPSLKFVNPEQAHLTLAFLGEVELLQIERVVIAMQQSIDVRPFQMTFDNFGIFPPRGAPRVLWLAVSEGAANVVAIQRAVAKRLAGVGVTLEDRPFHPHLTIGRWRQSRPADRRVLPAEPPRVPTEAMTVDHVTLYESRLSSEGSTHIERARALLT